MLTDKSKTKEIFSRIYKSETIITEILYCPALVKPYDITVRRNNQNQTMIYTHKLPRRYQAIIADNKSTDIKRHIVL